MERVIELGEHNIGDYAVNPVPEIKITDLGENIELYGAISLGLDG